MASTPLTLTAAMAEYDRLRPIADGVVAADGITVQTDYQAPSEIFYNLLTAGDYDLAEMSLSSYLIASAQGRTDRMGGAGKGWGWTAIPVFPNRRLFHLSLWVRADGVRSPRELVGARIGLTEYQVTAAVWTRGTLHHDFGVDPTTVHWYVERSADLSHGGATGFRAPDGITIQQLPDGETLQSGLEKGELDAILPSPYPGLSSRLNRTDEGRLEQHPELVPLFSDPRAEAARYLREHGFLPANHTVVVRDRLLRDNPWLAGALFDLFEAAKAEAYSRLDDLRRSHLVLAGTYLREERELFGPDPYPYGLARNRATLETLSTYMWEQGLIPERVVPATYFW